MWLHAVKKRGFFCRAGRRLFIRNSRDVEDQTRFSETEMNHKRKRPKKVRAGCLLCKPNKLGMGTEKKLGHRGFGKLRREAAAQQDLADAT